MIVIEPDWYHAALVKAGPGLWVPAYGSTTAQKRVEIEPRDGTVWYRARMPEGLWVLAPGQEPHPELPRSHRGSIFEIRARAPGAEL